MMGMVKSGMAAAWRRNITRTVKANKKIASPQIKLSLRQNEFDFMTKAIYRLKGRYAIAVEREGIEKDYCLEARKKMTIATMKNMPKRR